MTEKIIEGEGKRFELWWKWNKGNPTELWIKDTTHTGVKHMQLGNSYPTPDEMDFVVELNTLHSLAKSQSVNAAFQKRVADFAIGFLDGLLPQLDNKSAIAAKVAEALATINGMDYTAEDRK